MRRKMAPRRDWIESHIKKILMSGKWTIFVRLWSLCAEKNGGTLPALRGAAFRAWGNKAVVYGSRQFLMDLEQFQIPNEKKLQSCRDACIL